MDLASLSDADLLTRWCAGDPLAGDALTTRHHAALRSMLRRKLDDRAAIEDIVQKTWLELLKGRLAIREGIKFRGYLNCIASRQVYRYYQDRGHHPGEFDEETVTIAAISSTPGLQRKQETKLLYRALRELPYAELLTIELYLWEELTAPEIAEVTKVHLSKVRNRLRRAKEKLEALVLRFSNEPGASDVDTQELVRWFEDFKRQAAQLIKPSDPEA